MDFFKKERFLTTGENSTANLFWSLTICGFPHTVTPKTRHIILDAVHAIRNMLLSHRASFFTVKIIGAMYLAKEEMTYQGKKIRVAAKILKQYSRNPFVEQKLTLKECIRYTRQIKSLFWKLLAFTLVLFIQMHMYFVVAAVFVWMSSLGIDSL